MNTQLLGEVLDQVIISYLLLCTPYLSFQKWHKIVHQMLQNQLMMEIDIPTKAQTTLKLCLIARCQQDQLELGHLGSDASAIE
jgi:hypothetical protein